MKRITFFAAVICFMLSGTMASAGNKDMKAESSVKIENKLSEEEITRYTNRIEEIRNMDKSDMNASDRKELRNEMKDMKQNVKRAGGTVYIGGTTLLLIIILLIILL